MLSNERGILVPVRSRTELAEATLRILGDPDLKHRLEREAYAYGRETAWPRIGERMLRMLRAATVESDVEQRGRRFMAGALSA